MACPVPQFTQPSCRWSLHLCFPASPLPQGLGIGLSRLLALFPFLKKPSLPSSSPPDSLLRSHTEGHLAQERRGKSQPRAGDGLCRFGAASPSPPRAPPRWSRPALPAPAPSRRHWPFKSLSARCRPGSARETIKILCRMKMGQVSSFLAPIQ